MSINSLLAKVKEDPTVLWYDHAGTMVVYVRNHVKGDIFFVDGKPFSAWEGGCGIGHAATLDGAKKIATAWLRKEIKRKLEEAKRLVLSLQKAYREKCR